MKFIAIYQLRQNRVFDVIVILVLVSYWEVPGNIGFFISVFVYNCVNSDL